MLFTCAVVVLLLLLVPDAGMLYLMGRKWGTGYNIMMIIVQSCAAVHIHTIVNCDHRRHMGVLAIHS